MEIKSHVSLREYTTFKIGGEAEYFSVVTNLDELKESAKFALDKNLTVTILGGGSNVLVADEGVSGLVILNQLSGISYEEVAGEIIATVSSGVMLDDLVADTVAKEYWGMENLSHIPGTVGATPVQNVGAYGVEVSDLIVSVDTFNLKTLTIKKFSNTECNFSYRDSLFKNDEAKNLFITAVSYRLSKKANPKINYKDLQVLFGETNPSQRDIRQAVIKIRSNKFPDWSKLGTAGSFFKNPIISRFKAIELIKMYPDLPVYPVDEDAVKISLSWFLDKVLNLRGYTIGPVGTFEKHVLVVVNQNGNASDVKKFAKYVSDLVLEKLGIELEWEVTQLPCD
ncbi:UDP-N-acetylmuramate dehydrogenase [Candidatus Kaiserbacteria bacterium]|nr:UDP-N-acetylmuramate dehydrogenase [Candidatus Kaiserbacteria bacterium]